MAAGGTLSAGEVQIERKSGLLWATVTAKGHSFHFVIDTGASITVLSPESARRLDMPWGRPTRVEAIGGGARAYQSSEFPGLLAGLALPSKVLVMDLSAPSRSCGHVIDGLIGADFFQGKIVQIDYAHRVMRCLDYASKFGDSLPMKFQNGVICVPVAVNGCTPRWTRLDTGCTDELHWSVVGTKWSRASTPLSVALSASSETRTRLPVEVGSERLDDIPVTLHAKEIFPGEAGLLGNAVLSKFLVTIDAVRNRIALER